MLKACLIWLQVGDGTASYNVPHASFRMGMERVVAWIYGHEQRRETITFARAFSRINP